MTNVQLVKVANKALLNSYSPYSNFKVGAALLCSDGTIFSGTNVENASYGATICAERTAIVSAVASGYGREDFIKLAITSEMNAITPPCGMCRQVMVEFFNDNVEVILANTNLEMTCVTISDLVPYPFSEKELEEHV